MSQIEITPAMLNDLRQKAEAAGGEEWLQGIVYEVIRSIDKRKVVNDINLLPFYKDHIAAASPAVVLAIIDEIKRLNERFDEQKLLATRMIEHAAEQKKEIERLRDRLDKLVCPNCGDLRKCCMCDVEQPEASNADQA